MNNLLRTLTQSQVKPAVDLRLLLTTVKETRRQSYDSKLSDPFYDSLDNLLSDLKSITIDNRDAEAFLKPVSRAEVPDYYDYITNPMDFATMGKKVKNKQYKSKREFKDDLELIWSNCYKYNAAEDHPLRQCVNRLRLKADRLLKHITDRKDRTDPPIPSELASSSSQPGIARPKINGDTTLNGSCSFSRSPSSTPTATFRRRKGVPFAEMPALVRTGDGMLQFRELDRGLGGSSVDHDVVRKLKEVAPHGFDSESDNEDEFPMAVDGVTGDKRKLNGMSSKPRKRTRFSKQDDPSQLWWRAVQSDALLANGLPDIPVASSSQLPSHKPKRRKKKPLEKPPPEKPKALLTLMNNNIKTMRRMRQTHTKFAALNAATTVPDDPDGSGEAPYGGGGLASAFGTAGIGAGFGGFPSVADEEVEDDKIDERHWVERIKGKQKKKAGLDIGEGNAQECVTWAGEKILEHSGFQGTSRMALDVLAGVASEYLLNVGRTIRFLSDKYSKTMTPEEIMLHTLFESGVSKIQDLERYISDDIERYGIRLGELEKKIAGVYRESTAGQEMLEDEGLFDDEDEEETGVLAMGDFADALGEDYLGLRELGIAEEFGLSNLTIPKRLLKNKKPLQPAAAKPVERPLDYPLPPPFVPLIASKVEDQIGLLKPYYQRRFEQLAASRASETQPPAFPLPQPPRASASVNGHPYPNLPGPSLPPAYPPNPYASTNATVSPSLQPPTAPDGSSSPPPPKPPIPPPDMVLPDDPPNPSQIKMAPLGQITKPSTTSTSTKKKAKIVLEEGGASGPLVSAPVGPGLVGGVIGPDGLQQKKKGPTGVGTGNGRKKKSQQPPPPGLALPLSAVSSQQGPLSAGSGYHAPGQGQGQGQGSPFPAVVVASA